MDWFEKMKGAVSQLVLTQSVSGKAKLLPREVLAQNIVDSMAFLANADHMGTVRGKLAKPRPCYVVNNDMATVTLKYCRTPVMLKGNGDTVVVPENELGMVLSHLKAAVEQKEFDGQLAVIKAKRMEQLGKGKTEKQAA